MTIILAIIGVIILGTLISCIDFVLAAFIWLIKVATVIGFIVGMIWLLFHVCC